MNSGAVSFIVNNALRCVCVLRRVWASSSVKLSLPPAARLGYVWELVNSRALIRRVNVRVMAGHGRCVVPDDVHCDRFGDACRLQQRSGRVAK